MDESGVFFARGLGVCMMCITLSPYYAGMDTATLAKVYMPLNVIFMGLFLQASFVLETTGPGKNALLPINLWHTQLPIAAGFLVLNMMAVQEDASAKKK